MIKISTAFLEKQFFDSPIFSCQKWQSKDENFEAKKNNSPFLPPIFDEIPNKYEWQSNIFKKNLRIVFWFRRVNQFWRVFDGQKNCQNWFTLLNQKRVLRFFLNMLLCHSYLLGISSKIGGEWGNMDFFGIDVLFFDDHFWQDEVDKSKSFFS